MFHIPRPRCWLLSTLIGVSLVSGCASTGDGSPSGLASLFPSEARQKEEEERHRKRFQEGRDPEAMCWLLANRVESGQSPMDVGRVLGEQGERVVNDGWIKNDGGYYQTGDECWKWGPDREGHSVLLVFREGRLVNFDPREFQDYASRGKRDTL